MWQSTEKVLIMVYMDGVRLNDVAKLKELGVDMQALVESITRSYAHQIYVDGFFNADPHPGQHFIYENWITLGTAGSCYTILSNYPVGAFWCSVC